MCERVRCWEQMAERDLGLHSSSSRGECAWMALVAWHMASGVGQTWVHTLALLSVCVT